MLSINNSLPRTGSLWPSTARNSQKRYSTFNRELLVTYPAVRHLKFPLEGRQFFNEMDHKPLTPALYRVSEPWSARQQRQLRYLAEYTSDIWHVAGSWNVVADILSRPPATFVGEPGVAANKPWPPLPAL